MLWISEGFIAIGTLSIAECEMQPPILSKDLRKACVSICAARSALFASRCLPRRRLAQTRHEASSHARRRTCSEIARQPKSRVVAGDLRQREVFEPERAVRRRNSAKPAAATPRQPVAARAQTTAGTVPGFSGFAALLDNFTAIPPDTQGAVGPNHVVTMLNTQVLIQSRGGLTQANFPITLNAFWSPLGTFSDTFDPRVLYDSVADRWIASAAVNSVKSSSALLLATTQTGDPTGKWNYYRINVGNTNQWGDFPALGFNANWVVVSMNLFQIRPTEDYISTALYVFSKADLYDPAGTGKNVTFTDFDGEFTPVYDYDNSSPNTLYLTQEFSSENATTTGTGEIRISKLTGAVGKENFSGGNGGTAILSDAWADAGADEDFGPQPGSSVKIDTGDSRLVNCLMRAGMIWCSHTVFLPYDQPRRAAAQWFQLDPSKNPPAILQHGRIDDPTSTFYYAYPSIAVNKNNDALIAYTRFSANDYPTAAFAYRTAKDPLNAMQPEVLIKAGEAPYVSLGARSGMNRWGDYSATVVDPVNDLTFWTIQEYASTPPSTHTGAFGTWWAQVTAPSAASPCSYSLTPSKASFDNSGGTGSIAIATSAGCPWQAAGNASWIAITAGSPGSGNGTVQYEVSEMPGATDSRTGVLTAAGQSFPITQGPPSGGLGAPVFTSAGLVNAASMQTGAVAPGEVITLFGTNLGPAALQKPAVNGGQVDTIAGGTRFLFDGIAAPMIYAVSNQAAAVVPFAVQGHSTAQFQVEYQGTRSAPVTLPVAAASPAIFTASQSGKGQGAILNGDGSVNTQATPTSAGDTIVIYATGGGALTPAVPDGAFAQAPLGKLAQPYSLRIGGLPATVTYAGSAPGIIPGRPADQRGRPEWNRFEFYASRGLDDRRRDESGRCDDRGALTRRPLPHGRGSDRIIAWSAC